MRVDFDRKRAGAGLCPNIRLQTSIALHRGAYMERQTATGTLERRAFHHFVLRRARPVFGLFFWSSLVATPMFAQNTTEFVNELAQGCYAVQSPKTGKFLRKYHKGGNINDGLSYRFESVGLDAASRFFMKPTSFGNYMMTDRDGRYLAGQLLLSPTAGKKPGVFAEWKLTASGSMASEYLVHFTNNALNLKLAYNYKKDKLVFSPSGGIFEWHKESKFRLVAQSNCRPFPEVMLNVEGSRNLLKGDPSKPVRGFMEAHAHITSYEFLGGKAMHGKPFHRFGVEKALPDSAIIHGPDGITDFIGNFFSGKADNYDTRGWPDFPYWPDHRDMSHMGYYYKWIERAHLGGMRLLVTHLVENKTLCVLLSKLNPAAWINPNSCDAMDSIRLQAQRLYEMQDYIDAQAGGPGKGFFRIITSPEEARQVIANGQMAILIGVEASETFNCGIGDPCTPETIDTQLEELYALGIRSIFPTHKFDNQFGGSQVREGNGVINIGHYLNTGHFWEVEACDAETKGTYYKSGFPEFGDEAPWLELILPDLSPEYDETIESCNRHGLSDLGVYLVNRLIDKNMLIEIDHSSSASATKIMDIIEARNYSGVVSSHGWMSKGKDGGLHRNSKRLIRAGGYIAPDLKSNRGIEEKIARVLAEVEKTSYLQGVGFSTDMSGLANQAGPRPDSSSNPLQYPFKNEFGFVFYHQVSGNRVFDLNRDGVAHYGMLPDQMQDLREQSSIRLYESIMNSAEAYLQMWERAEANTNRNFIDPL